MTDQIDEAAKLKAYLAARKAKKEVSSAVVPETPEAPAEKAAVPPPAAPKDREPEAVQAAAAPPVAQEGEGDESQQKSEEAAPFVEKRKAQDEPAVAESREDKLKAFLKQKREDDKPTGVDEDDPFGGDDMARKYLWNLQKYLEREDIADIKEVVINRPCEVGLEFSDGHWEWIDDPAMTLDNLEDMARMLANRSGQLFHPGNPILSVKMPGGHRVQVVAGFNAPTGFVFSMRMSRKENFALEDFHMPAEEIAAIRELARSAKTMILSGGTGTGKTSFMNALIPSIPDHERLITLEDVAELKIPHRNWAPLLFAGNNTTQGDQGVIALLNACLRLRPDRIILGEIRKENAFAFCSAINTGHEGSMATIHANTPKMAINAVINRVLMNGDMPDSALNVLREQLIDDIHAVVQLTRKGAKIEAYLTVLTDEDKAAFRKG